MLGDKSSSSSTSSNESVIYKINDKHDAILSSSDHISNLRNKKLTIMCNALKSNKENALLREQSKINEPSHQSNIPLSMNLKNIPQNIHLIAKQCNDMNNRAFNQQGKLVNGIDRIQERVKMVHVGYASDGEYHCKDEIAKNLGYVSEGSSDNASQYARKMQERLKEGMLAVRECMQKTNAMLIDDESYDDASSISSSELSDAINDMSTDDNQTMSSLSTLSSGMSYLKKAATKYQGIGDADKSIYASKSLPAYSKPRTQDEMQNFSTLTRHNPYLKTDSSQIDYRKPSGYTGAMLIEKSYQARVISDLCQKSYSPNNVGMALENEAYGRAKMKDMETNTNMSSKILLHHNSMPSKMTSPLRIGLTIGRDYKNIISKNPIQSANIVRKEPVFNRSLSTASDCVANEFLLSNHRPLSDDVSGNILLENGELSRHKCLSDCENDTKRRNEDVDNEVRRSLVSRTDSLTKKATNTSNEAFGSCLSLTSNNSSIYSNNEDKQMQEVRRLKRELESAQEKINTLTTQITTNAHVVSAFEQSLTNMTKRLKHLTNASQQKDHELKDLRNKVEELKKLQKGSQHQNHKQKDIGSSVEDNLLHLTSLHHGSNDMQDIISIDSKKKKNWLRASLGRAFGGKNKFLDSETTSKQAAFSTPCTPTHKFYNGLEGGSETVHQLKKQLHDKDLKLTDVQLEALASAHQLEQLYDIINKMKCEIASLKSENERLHTIINQNGIKLDSVISPQSYSETESGYQLTISRNNIIKEEQNLFKIYVSTNEEYLKIENLTKKSKIGIGVLYLDSSTTWEMLDVLIKKSFKEYVSKLTSNIGLNSDSISLYKVSGIVRTRGKKPELLPLACSQNNCHEILIYLKGSSENCIDELCFETLVPRSIMQRYVALLQEHKQIILFGPKSSGKTFLSHKLAEHIQTLKNGRGAIALYNVREPVGSEDLVGYLSNVLVHSDIGTSPSVIIIANLHLAPKINDVFAKLQMLKTNTLLCIIATFNQSSSRCGLAQINLHTHQSFRWVQYVCHLEPLRGFLQRFLLQKLTHHRIDSYIYNAKPDIKRSITCNPILKFSDNSNQLITTTDSLQRTLSEDTSMCRSQTINDDIVQIADAGKLEKVIEWLPKIWQNLNTYLESKNAEFSLGPCIFIDCPMDIGLIKIWFSKLWNETIVPSVRNILNDQLKNLCDSNHLDNPLIFVHETCPWKEDEMSLRGLSDFLTLDTEAIFNTV